MYCVRLTEEAYALSDNSIDKGLEVEYKPQGLS